MKTIKIAMLVALFGAVSVAAQDRQARSSFAPIGFTGETGNVCVRDFQPGANCVASDVTIESFTPVQTIDTCGADMIATMVFEATITANMTDRYDIGLFVSLDGNTARDGDDCFHDFISSSDSAFLDLDGDSCGDIEGGTQLTKTLIELTFDCVDRDMDGEADISACSSWGQNQNNEGGELCQSLSDAFPSTNSKCGCQILNLGFPIPVELESFSIER